MNKTIKENIRSFKPGGEEEGFDGDFDMWIIFRVEMNWIRVKRNCGDSEKTVEEKVGCG